MSTANPANAETPPTEFVQSLERGLAVLRTFSSEHRSLTVTDVATRAELSRAAARRFLHTLQALGYVTSDGKHFELTPKVLDLGYAYLSSLNISDVAEPYMEGLSSELHESVSVAVLDGADIVYVARVPTKRIMTISLSIGSRLPALVTSMGRVLLGGLTDDELRNHIRRHPLTARSDRTTTDADELFNAVRFAARQGWALLDQELEDGVRSVAAPLRNRRGFPIAAINVSTHAGRVTLNELRTRFVPALLRTAEAINGQLAKR